jgi:hypothetical protein
VLVVEAVAVTLGEQPQGPDAIGHPRRGRLAGLDELDHRHAAVIDRPSGLARASQPEDAIPVRAPRWCDGTRSEAAEVAMHVQNPRLFIVIFVVLVVVTAIYLFIRGG